MKKLILLLFLCVFGMAPAFSKHIIGGEMFYTYMGKGQAPNTSRYKITLRLFRDDHAPADAAAMPQDVYIGIFNNDNSQQFPSPGGYYTVVRSTPSQVKVNEFPICMVQRPNLSYQSAEFSFEVELPDNQKGYTASYQTCCRITPIDNIFGGGSGAGSTFSCTIPPEPDSSPIFNTTIDAVCGGKQFNLEFTATDVDNDSLSYAFESAFDGGRANDARNINPSPPPYQSVGYRGAYSGFAPLGEKASIDPITGKITGIAPPTGRYVVTVAVTSWRKLPNSDQRYKLSTHRKDFIINVSNCDFASAQLNPRGSFCEDFLVSFENDDYSQYNETFYWKFYNSDESFVEESTEEFPEIQFPEAGDYHYMLIVNPGDACSDTAKATLGVYPGFFPDFEFDGQCINSEVFFTDRSTATYGSVNSWKWDFGDGGVRSDTSIERNPMYTYGKAGNYEATLTVTSSVGCSATVKANIPMIEKPEFKISKDTLICSVDELELAASGRATGSITWTPDYRIDNVNSFNPIVTPQTTTTYYANYEESRGCNNVDSVTVHVVNEVALSMPRDTTICLTDSIVLRPRSDGLHYEWDTSPTISDRNSKTPIVSPTENTIYRLTASIGNCSTTGNVRVNTVPYPAARATEDTALCIGNTIQLEASGGSIYEWQPAIFLNESKTARPVSSPTRSIQYIVKVNDVLGCPKPSFDTVNLNVVTPYVDAGPRDTAIVIDEPLQLSATGNGENFLWTPSTGLSNPEISNPIALLTNDQQYVVRLITEGSCIATDTIMVKVYDLKPGFYIPNAFTPNRDGLNDQIRPIAFGLRSLKYFRIYNRLGQLVFHTTDFNEGWDGTFQGAPQAPAVFAWTAEAVDYTGKIIQEKGSITLIR